MGQVTKESCDWLTDAELRNKLGIGKTKFYAILSNGQRNDRADDFRLIFSRRVGKVRLWSLTSYAKWCSGDL